MKNDFKKELKKLLEKYNASIGLEFHECSDTSGMIDVKMVAYIGKEEILLSEDYGVDVSDL